MIDQSILADAERKTLINACRLLVRFAAFHIFAAAGVERIVNIFVRAFARLFLGDSTGTKHSVRIPVLGIEIESFWIRDEAREIVSVLPFAICAAVSGREHIIRDLILEELWLGAALQCPV